MTDCLIIGGGLIGMFTARELAQAGLDVTLMERGVLGGESSWAGGGILSPLYPWRYPDAVNHLATWSQRQYPYLSQTLFAQTGIDPEWTPSGLLILDMDDQDEAMRWAGQNHAQIERLDHPALGQAEARLDHHFDTAMLMAEVAQIRNPRLIAALRQDLIKRGVMIIEHAEAKALLTKNGRIMGIASASGEITAESVVIANGAWSGDLLKASGITLDVVPVRGQMLLYKTTPGLISHIMVSGGRYLIPRRDGHVLVGSTVEYAGFDKSTTAQAADELRQFAVALAPDLEGCDIRQHWAGLRPGTTTGIPFVGAHPLIKGLYVNTGHFRNGVLLGPASARLLADIMLGRPPLLDPAPYALS